MNFTSIPFRDTRRFSSLFLDYVDDAPALRTFYAHRPTEAGMAAAIEAKRQQPIDRALLADALNNQYEGIEAPQAVLDNVEALRSENTFTITTGHQLCLFTGPLYFIYKIATVVNAARAMSQQHPDKRFVPVYWMASEDHDFEEINHANVFGKTITWNADAGGAVGWLPTGALESVLHELKELLGDRPGAAEVNALMARAYLKHENLADATRYLVNALFGEYGLVIVDGDDRKLKSAFSKVMWAEAEHHQSSAAVESASAKLEQLGYKTQVTPREINLFFLGEGYRSRLVADGELYRVLDHDIQFSKSELQAEIEQHPAMFSPNVVLRPLYQEMVLPNIAYVGGPGELAYWLQLKPVFDLHNVPFPVLQPRHFVLWLDQGLSKRKAKLELSTEALFQDIEEQKKAFVAREAEHTLDLGSEKQQLSAVFDAVLQKAVAIDPTMKGVVEGERQRQLKSIEGLEKRLLKAEKQRHEVSLNQLENLHSKLFPNGSLQERHDNFIPFYLQHGGEWIKMLEQFDPFDLRMVIFSSF